MQHLIELVGWCVLKMQIYSSRGAVGCCLSHCTGDSLVAQCISLFLTPWCFHVLVKVWEGYEEVKEEGDEEDENNASSNTEPQTLEVTVSEVVDGGNFYVHTDLERVAYIAEQLASLSDIQSGHHVSTTKTQIGTTVQNMNLGCIVWPMSLVQAWPCHYRLNWISSPVV